jgi:hypothetical protein
MVFIDLRCFVVLVVYAVNTSVIFLTCLTFMHFMALGTVWTYYIPETFLCPMIVFGTFVAVRNTQILITVAYMLAYFKFSVY